MMCCLKLILTPLTVQETVRKNHYYTFTVVNGCYDRLSNRSSYGKITIMYTEIMFLSVVLIVFILQ